MSCPTCHGPFEPFRCTEPGCGCLICEECPECHAERAHGMIRDPNASRRRTVGWVEGKSPVDDDGATGEVVPAPPAEPDPVPDEQLDEHMARLGWERAPHDEGDQISVQYCYFCSRAVTSEEILYALLLEPAPSPKRGREAKRVYCCYECARTRLPSTPSRWGMHASDIPPLW